MVAVCKISPKFGIFVQKFKPLSLLMCHSKEIVALIQAHKAASCFVGGATMRYLAPSERQPPSAPALGTCVRWLRRCFTYFGTTFAPYHKRDDTADAKFRFYLCRKGVLSSLSAGLRREPNTEVLKTVIHQLTALQQALEENPIHKPQNRDPSANSSSAGLRGEPNTQAPKTVPYQQLPQATRDTFSASQRDFTTVAPNFAAF